MARCKRCGKELEVVSVAGQPYWHHVSDSQTITYDHIAESFELEDAAPAPDVEAISARVHEQWMANKRAQGVTSRKSESGEELMVPYAELSEAAKELDRGSVRVVLEAMK